MHGKMRTCARTAAACHEEGNVTMYAELCVFDPERGEWQAIVNDPTATKDDWANWRIGEFEGHYRMTLNDDNGSVLAVREVTV